MSAAFRQAHRPLPPFGRDLLDSVRMAGAPRNLMIFTGPDAWLRAKSWPRGARLVLPHDHSPDDFDWSYVRGLELVISGRDESVDRLERLVYHCIVARAALISLIYDVDGVPRIQCYRPSELDHVQAISNDRR